MKKAIYIILAVAIIIKLGFLNMPSAAPPDFVENYQSSVVLYATSWCGYCKKTRNLLEKNGIEYIEYDIEKSAQGKKEYDQLGGRGVPLMLIGGKTVKGYAPEHIIKLAKELRKQAG